MSHPHRRSAARQNLRHNSSENERASELQFVFLSCGGACFVVSS